MKKKRNTVSLHSHPFNNKIMGEFIQKHILGLIKKIFKNHQLEDIIMADATTEDPTGWMIDNVISEFLLMPTTGIVYMCMLAYAFVHGT